MEWEDPFLSQIAQFPEDITIRLVYADCLEEREDPRSELIRIEAELATIAPHTDKYIALKQHRRWLRAKTSDQWLRTMGFVPKHCPFFKKMPALRSDRWRLVEDFVETWDGPLQATD